MPKRTKTSPAFELTAELRERILGIISQVPVSSREPAKKPEAAVRPLIARAALDSAGISGALALPTGPATFFTILPDLYAIWKRQARLVADIAAVYGKTEELDEETLLYCLFRYAAAQAAADLTVRVAGRQMRRLSIRKALYAAAERAGLSIARRTIRRAAVRWVPLLGAAGVAGYAYYDTTSVGRTAQRLFAAKTRKKSRKKAVKRKAVKKAAKNTAGKSAKKTKTRKK